jgi:hypothetical protein
MGLVYRGCRSVAVADVPDAPLSTVGVGVPNFDRLHPLGAGVGRPPLSGLASEGAAVAGIPDQVGGFEGHGHGSFRFDAVSLQGQGISQAPGRTLL